MNIIRTRVVELTSIPAIAYKQKLASGGAGIKLQRLDSNETAVGTIDRRTGGTVPYGVVDEDLFPMEAFDEAIELTIGLPYSARGAISILNADVQTEDVTEMSEPEQIDMSLSQEYTSLVERYSDEKGKLNYQLMNKDFIQFASRSKVVGEMVGSGATQDEILTFVLKSRVTEISGQKQSLDDASVKLLIETLDEIDPRSAFKELKSHINRMLTRKKR